MIRIVGKAAVGLAVATTVFGSIAGASAVGAATSPKTADLTLVHGIRGLVASVQLDGKSVITSFSPRRSVGPLKVAAGQHRITVTRPGDHKILFSRVVNLTPGEHMTAALGLNPSGNPHLYAYPDWLRRTAAAPATLVMRDVAATARLHAMVDGKDDGAIGDGHQLVHAVSVGRHTVSLVDPQTGKVAVAPERIPVNAGAVTALYLIGSARQADLGWVATRVAPSGTTPTAVETGNSGLAASHGTPRFDVGLALVGALGLVGAYGMRRRKTFSST